MIDPEQLRDHVIIPTLEHLQEYNEAMYSDAAVNLLLATQAHESLGGRYLKQIEGPALGIYQIEPETHKDVYVNFASHRPALVGVLGALQRSGSPDDQLIYDLKYATAIARVIYWRAPEPLPAADDMESLAGYWKAHYNTVQGSGTIHGFLADLDKIRGALL